MFDTEKLIDFCEVYKINCHFDPVDFKFTFLSESLGAVEIPYSDLSRSFPEYFPPEEDDTLQGTLF